MIYIIAILLLILVLANDTAREILFGLLKYGGLLAIAGVALVILFVIGFLMFRTPPTAKVTTPSYSGPSQSPPSQNLVDSTNPSSDSKPVPRAPSSGTLWSFVDEGGNKHFTNVPSNPRYHAKLNVSGNNWECAYGYRRSDTECVAVQVPRNAKLNVSGNNWECAYGYRRVGNECVRLDKSSEGNK